MKKTFPIEVVLSLTTGVLLVGKERGGFGAVHEIAEHVAGHPIWTHEFAERSLWHRLTDAVFAQHPAMVSAEAFEKPADVPMDDYIVGYVSRARCRFGNELAIEQGSEHRTENPIASAERIFAERRRD